MLGNLGLKKTGVRSDLIDRLEQAGKKPEDLSDIFVAPRVKRKRGDFVTKKDFVQWQ